MEAGDGRGSCSTGKRRKAYNAVSTPIVQTSNYSFESTSEVWEFMKAKAEGRIIREHEYGRYFNPTQQEVERKLAAIEGAERAITFSSGMSALILTVLAYVKKGGHVVFTNDCYRQTRDFANNWLTKFRNRFHVCGSVRRDAIEQAIRPDHEPDLYGVADESISARARFAGDCESGQAAQVADGGGSDAGDAI